MKKIVYIFAVLLLVSVKASAQNPQLIIDDCVAPIGGQVVVVVKYNTEGKNYSGVNFNIDLPEDGLTYELDNKGNVAATLDASNSDFTIVTSKNGFAPFSASAYLAGEEGILLTFVLNVAPDLTKDQELTCNVRNIAFTSAEGTKISLDPFTFVVKISDRWVLNETSAAVPAASDGEVNVTVKRTINANEWGTICLPFDMTAEQITAVFGEKAQFAIFNNYTKDGGNASTKQAFTATNIVINFDSYDWSEDGIFANVPYLIKSANSFESFDLDNVTIDPDEGGATNEYKRSGKVVGTYFGTLHAGQYIPEYGLFLNSGKFYYSKGKTKIKAFRGYFVLNDVLADLSSASVKVNVDGEATSIDGMHIQYATEGVYDLSGRKIQLQDGDLNKLQKGVYIIDGKKVTIK